jgi:[ribosomal protein S5]-alanine N-acetyltransferase
MIAELHTERLTLVPMQLHFANERYLAWLNDAEVNKYLEIFTVQTLPNLISYVKHAVEAKFYFWAITLTDNGKHIGNIKIDPINKIHQYGEYGILLGDKSEWGKGYAKEASQVVIDYCFNALDLRKVNLGVVTQNTAAVELYKQLGFVVEGTYKHHGNYQGEYCDLLRMAVFNKKYNY